MSGSGLPRYVAGPIVKGFGRGSKELGIPTANLPQDVVDAFPQDVPNGVYYGWASLNRKEIYKMVMNIGWCPYYKNVKKSMEVHLLHQFAEDMYGAELRVVILGFIRPEKDFSSVESLIAEINNDIAIATRELDSPKASLYKNNVFLRALEAQHLGAM